MELGIDPPDVQQVIIFPGPSTTSSPVQSASQLVWAVPDTQGEVFVYFTDIQENPTDEWLLMENNRGFESELDGGPGKETLI